MWEEFEVGDDEYIIGWKGSMTKNAFKDIHFVWKKLVGESPEIPPEFQL